uniref:Uncharacterized protein n=1 Tax=Arundo donax TaxID=35708 RepID=A0A0A8XNF1_ARUDO
MGSARSRIVAAWVRGCSSHVAILVNTSGSGRP